MTFTEVSQDSIMTLELWADSSWTSSATNNLVNFTKFNQLTKNCPLSRLLEDFIKDPCKSNVKVSKWSYLPDTAGNNWPDLVYQYTIRPFTCELNCFHGVPPDLSVLLCQDQQHLQCEVQGQSVLRSSGCLTYRRTLSNSQLWNLCLAL